MEAGSVSSRLKDALHPLKGATTDYDLLLERIGEARIVLLGEATHGTHEFYQARADISKRLIREKEFSVIAWEADWPDALRVNRFVRGEGRDASAREALDDFKRFPSWMWRNADVLDFVGWLRDENVQKPANAIKTSVYGLDLYCLYASIEAVIEYLETVSPEAAGQARRRYGCFEDLGENAETYGLLSAEFSCEAEVIEQLVELQRRAGEFLGRDGRRAADELFFAEQNARVVKNAERYYRAMYHGGLDTWNLRDTHMADTLDELMAHLERQGERPKVIVWAHNSHLGDARATDMSRRGEINLGQLLRERHGGDVRSVGFTTYTGTVAAASKWDGPVQCQRVRPALPESFERRFHDSGERNFLLTLRNEPVEELEAPALERAIGVIYKPATERWSHYFESRLKEQFDAVIHFDETRAVEPMERRSEVAQTEPEETFPFGL
ncbi:MAG TPA: erythromycin esterase family protein [Verrucomicrobiae bacterium]|nr:erythromycin esterase family protein [Verrucomicrobiae bacterium]